METIDILRSKRIVEKALTYDLAYSSARLAPDEKVQFFKDEILKDTQDTSTYCFTNWSGSPWDIEQGGSWNPLTKIHLIWELFS